MRSALVGIALIFAFSWPIDLGLAAQSRGLLPFTIPPVLGLLIGYAIVAGTLFATWLEGGRRAVFTILGGYVRWRVGVAWYGVALLLFPAAYLLALAFDSALGGVRDTGTPYVMRFVPAGLSLLVVVPGWFLFEMLTNGEEIAWRGYVLPRLQARYAALAATALVAAVWALWHLPKWLVIPSTYDQPAWLWLSDLVAKAVIATWLFNHARGSLLILTLFHASYNTAAGTLPILPDVAGDLRPWTIAVAIMSLVAVGLIVRDRSLGYRPRAVTAESGVSAVAVMASRS